MTGQGQLIESLASSGIFRQYEDAYGQTMNLPLALRPVASWKLPFHGKRHENPFCALMAEQSATCAACLQLQERLALAGQDGPATLSCAYGLSEIVVPVKLGSQTVGFLQTGQVLRQRPTQAAFERVAARVVAMGAGWDERRARAAYFRTPVWSPRRLQALTQLLTAFAEHLAIKSNQIAVQEATAEPPAITRARRYIQEHFREDLTLAQVSRVVHTSVFYFCKLFRKVTGMTFTEFVARTRVENAKNLLLNPNQRVSEVAYAAGFQSLTHFNRMFKAIVGESPTCFRSRLPKAR